MYTLQFISSIISCLTHEGKVIPVHALKSGRVSRGVAPLIINLSTWWRWVVSLTSWLIYPQGQEYLVLVGGWVDPRDGLDILEKRASRFIPHIVQSLAQPVYWLHYHGSLCCDAHDYNLGDGTENDIFQQFWDIICMCHNKHFWEFYKVWLCWICTV